MFRDMLTSWPPRDWRALASLVFSVAGAVALTVLLYLLAGMLLPERGWTQASEGERVTTIRWVLWICAFCILLVLTGLGFSASRRALAMKAGDKSMTWAGGDQETGGEEERRDAEGFAGEDRAQGDRAGGEARGEGSR